MYQYTLSEEDITVYMLYYISSNKRIKNKGKRFLYILSGYFVLLAAISYATGYISTAIAMLCVALFWVIYTSFIRDTLMAKSIKKTIRKNHSEMIGLKIQFAVEDNHLHIMDSAGDYKYYVASIVSISELPMHFFIRMNNAHCFIVPKTNDEMEQGIRNMISKHNIDLQMNLDWKY